MTSPGVLLFPQLDYNIMQMIPTGNCVMQLESNTHISPYLAIESPVAQWLEHLYWITEGCGFQSYVGLGFFRVPSGFNCNTFHLMCVNHSLTFTHFGGCLAASFTEIQGTRFQRCSQCDCAMQL